MLASIRTSIAGTYNAVREKHIVRPERQAMVRNQVRIYRLFGSKCPGLGRVSAFGTQGRQCAMAKRTNNRRDFASRNLPIRRGLSEVESAIYLSLSPSFFRELVEQCVMPQPRMAGRRLIWDVEELDLAFKALPRKGGDDATFGETGGDSWTDYE